jgi:hypothetical protein
MTNLNFEYSRGGTKIPFDFQGIDIFSFYSTFNSRCCQKSLKSQIKRTFFHPKGAKDRSNDPSKWCISLEVRDIWKPLGCNRINSQLVPELNGWLIDGDIEMGQDHVIQARKVEGGSNYAEPN